MGGSCTCGRRRTCVRAVCRSSRSCRARLHADNLVDLLVELLPIRVDLRLRVRELLVGLRTRVGDLPVARVEQFLPAGLLAVVFTVPSMRSVTCLTVFSYDSSNVLSAAAPLTSSVADVQRVPVTPSDGAKNV